MRAAIELALRRLRRLARMPREKLIERRDAAARRRFAELVPLTRPMLTTPDADVQVHLLFGRSGMWEGIATAKSLLRFLSSAPSVVVHDDGTLRNAERQTIDHHLPGAMVIARTDADRELEAYFAENALPRCAALRRDFFMALKLFDLRYYGVGRRVLYVDTDVLFLHRPDELIAALAERGDTWRDRYNLDIHPAYTWTPAAVESATGVRLPERVNAGLFTLRRESLDFSMFEAALATGYSGEGRHFVEQTLNAIDLAAHDAAPLADEYDVCFRHTWRGNYYDWLRDAIGGERVPSQHYCGGHLQRAYYYSHFNEHVAPALT